MLSLDWDSNRRAVHGLEEGEVATRILHLQNLAMAWQFAGRFTSEELSQLWTITREALDGWKTAKGGSSR